MGLLKLLKILATKILLSPIRENIKCPKALFRVVLKASGFEAQAWKIGASGFECWVRASGLGLRV